MKQRKYLDVNCGIGRMSFREEPVPYTADDIINDMMYHRIHSALVFSNAAKDYSFVKGNRELQEQTARSTRLYSMAVVVPGIEYEVGEGLEYFDRLTADGVKAFKCYPRSMNFSFEPFFIEELAEYLAGRKMPLFIDIQETDYGSLRSVLDAFRELNVVLCNSSWASNRYLFPLMAKYPNLFFETSLNQANDILDICKKHFGVERVLFGSGYPLKAIGAAKALVEYSGLSDEEKDRVSYVNAAGLLGINPRDISLYAEEECMLDSIAVKVDAGQPLDDIQVIDAHSHMVDRSHFTVSQLPIINSDEDNLVRKMDRLGIDKIIVCPWEGLDTDGLSANRTALAARQKYMNRIEAYAMCNPNYDEDIETVCSFHEEHGFIGLKPYYIWNKYDLLGPKYEKWFEYGNRNRLIVLIHADGWEGIPGKVDVLAQKYTDIAFLLAHSGASYKIARDNLAIAKKRENVYLEITYSSVTNGIIEYLVKEAGADKVIFGTDMPMRDPAPQLAWVCYARISEEDKRKILGGNIRKLIGRCIRR